MLHTIYRKVVRYEKVYWICRQQDFSQTIQKGTLLPIQSLENRTLLSEALYASRLGIVEVLEGIHTSLGKEKLLAILNRFEENHFWGVVKKVPDHVWERAIHREQVRQYRTNSGAGCIKQAEHPKYNETLLPFWMIKLFESNDI